MAAGERSGDRAARARDGFVSNIRVAVRRFQRVDAVPPGLTVPSRPPVRTAITLPACDEVGKRAAARHLGAIDPDLALRKDAISRSAARVEEMPLHPATRLTQPLFQQSFAISVAHNDPKSPVPGRFRYPKFTTADFALFLPEKRDFLFLWRREDGESAWIDMRNPQPSRRRSVALFEAVESRQHMAVDLVASGITSSSPLMPGRFTTTTLSVTLNNQGLNSVGSNTGIVVSFYAQDDLLGPRTFVGSATVWGLRFLSSKPVSVNVPFMPTVDNDAVFVCEVDSQNAVAESNEANNHYQGVGIDMLSYSTEGDVSSPHGAVVPRSLPLDGHYIDGVIGDELISTLDIDTYKVSLQGGKTYWFEMYETNGSWGAMRLLDRNLNLIQASQIDPVVHGDGGAYIEYSPIITGDYYIAISSEQNINGSLTNVQNRTPGGSGPYKLAAAEKERFTVTLGSLDPAATESNWNDATSGLEFTVTRSWGNQWGRPLTINLENFGTFDNDLVDAIPLTVTIPANAPSVTFHTFAVNDGVNELAERQFVNIRANGDYVLSANTSLTLTILDNPETHRAFALSSGHIWQDLSGPRTFIDFSDDVGASISRDDYVLRNLDTNAVIPSSRYEVLWSPTINGSIVYFSGYENGQLPDGNYRMTLRKDFVYLPGGRQIESDVIIDFSSLKGDTNGDRKVDFADLLTLAQNYGQDLAWNGGAGKGDFDRSGTVDFADLLTLAQNYGHALSSPGAAGLVAGESSRVGGVTSRRHAIFAEQEAIV